MALKQYLFLEVYNSLLRDEDSAELVGNYISTAYERRKELENSDPVMLEKLTLNSAHNWETALQFVSAVPPQEVWDSFSGDEEAYLATVLDKLGGQGFLDKFPPNLINHMTDAIRATILSEAAKDMLNTRQTASIRTTENLINELNKRAWELREEIVGADEQKPKG